MRAPENDRNECVTRAIYHAGMIKDGYEPDARSPMVLRPVPDHLKWTADPRARLSYAAATCAESWLDAKRQEPSNPQIVITQKVGFTGCIDLRPWTSRPVLKWIVKEWNRHQHGSGFNIQQYCNMLEEYHSGFMSYMKTMEWDWDSFGVGAASVDSRTWEWMTDTYEAQGDLYCADINEYNHSRTFIKALKKSGLYDRWMDVIATGVDHRNNGDGGVLPSLD